METKFWIVWNFSSTCPKQRHPSKEDAIQEAGRLAQKQRGQTFFVLEAIGIAKVVDVSYIELKSDDGLDF